VIRTVIIGTLGGLAILAVTIGAAWLLNMALG
jgi:hypothetical protein